VLNARERATENEEAATNISDSTGEDEETESNEDESSTDKPNQFAIPVYNRCGCFVRFIDMLSSFFAKILTASMHRAF